MSYYDRHKIVSSVEDVQYFISEDSIKRGELQKEPSMYFNHEFVRATMIMPTSRPS